MFINGVGVGIGLLFLSLLYLNRSDHKPTRLVGGVIALFCWLLSGSVMLDEGGIFTRLYIASVPVVFFLLLPIIYRYQQVMTAYGSESRLNNSSTHWIPVILASLLSLSIGLMPNDDFDAMFITGSDQLSVWANLNSIGFFVLFVGWTALSFLYLSKIVMNTKTYHQRLQTEFANHEGKRLDWLVGFACLLVATWIYALIVLGMPSDNSTVLISETALSILVLILMWMFSIQALNREPAFSDSEPEPEDTSEQKYSNSSIDDERLKRIADKVERKVVEEKTYLNPDLDASMLASELGISVHYLSQVLSQEMQTNFYSYINDARIEAAKEELKNSKRTVLEIAMAVGFNTRSSFYNAFKQRTNMTPSKYKATATSTESIS
ncbi:AraC family transcriptional regulator [Reinekea sp. G2M2-21]|uniref:helix-turn-helix domain-containing protein n=1 Tax=Reinekea sp. G2M2-21 TaxID=2788942 RepID=UPI0018A8CFE5|nr:helix-turn-helix transcriptional regulator [Reinekea sp. G2M2-21]